MPDLTTDIRALFEANEEQRRAIESEALELSPELLGRSVKADEWTILQIIQHLVLADEQVGAPLPLDRRSGRPRRLVYGFIERAMRNNVRLPLPSPMLEPGEDVALPVLLARWEASRQTMRAFLESGEPAVGTPFSHPVAGALTTEMLLKLSNAHTGYHTRQMKRLRARLEQL